MSPITTHVLDTSLGKPAAGVMVVLSQCLAGPLQPLAKGLTDDDGRIMDWSEDFPFVAGEYQIRFETGPYFAATGRACFYPEVTVVFDVADTQTHYHVPLLLSPFGYSTYRGS